MRRLRPLRRRARLREREEESISPGSMGPDEEDEAPEYGAANFEPFVPVASGYGDRETPDEPEAESEDRPDRESRRRRWRLPRPHAPHIPLRRPALGLEIRFVVLLVAVVLIVAGIFGTLLNQGRIRANVEEWWPLALVIVAVLWMLIALVQRQVASFLGGAALAGVGLSLLMSTQDIADFKETLLGAVLITIGLGIVIRGLLLRQRAPL